MLDITGQKFGRLVAIKPTNEGSGKNKKWLFKCDCGNEKIISVSHVRSGKTSSCGCLRKEIAIRNGKNSAVDITGERFGRLVAIKPTDKRSCSGHIKWLFKCDCGNESIATANAVRQAHTSSCGCLQRDVVSVDITGERFGKLVAIKPTDERSGGKVKWLFKCDCGNETIIAASNVRNGNTSSCGCLRRNELKNIEFAECITVQTEAVPIFSQAFTQKAKQVLQGFFHASH
jgi:hypothetical protein